MYAPPSAPLGRRGTYLRCIDNKGRLTFRRPLLLIAEKQHSICALRYLLHLDKFGIYAALLHKGVVSTALGYAALVYYDYLVGIAYGA